MASPVSERRASVPCEDLYEAVSSLLEVAGDSRFASVIVTEHIDDIGKLYLEIIERNTPLQVWENGSLRKVQAKAAVRCEQMIHKSAHHKVDRKMAFLMAKALYSLEHLFSPEELEAAGRKPVETNHFLKNKKPPKASDPVYDDDLDSEAQAQLALDYAELAAIDNGDADQ